jgi:hypothetical protein
MADAGRARLRVWDGWLDGLPAESVTIETIALWRRNGVKI